MNFDITALEGLLKTYGINTVLFIVGIFATYVVAGWARRITVKALSKSGTDAALQNFLGKMVRWAVIAAGVVSCLGIFGIQTASFAAILASAGFAVGMALKGTLGNFAAGVMLLIFKPFKIDQVVKVAGETGKVVEIDIFNTILDTPDNRRIIVPNGNVFGGTIENISHHSTRRVDVSVGSDYGADLDKTRETLLTAAKSIEQGLADPAPAIVLTELGDSSVNWSVRLWVKSEDYWAVKDELTRRVKNSLDQANIGIPFPHMEINLNNNQIQQ